MTANATRRPSDGSTRSEGSFRRAVPMAGTGDGPRPDATTFAPAGHTAGGHGTNGSRADGRRATANRTADDATTQ
ncbi:hypothetical protein [Halorubrum sp. 2020YC2]|uniref:hypothetical protein n=1 Tax=Halorubrum sp. 2020YC2 TaxID=2836432 RepID=UPI001BEAD10B|nr:hypothetical protein [Halorubrum sp. 2020YC2]QWC18095.1 hypothetical protein KI388_07855 [Halorubrum sp. 2020YC2]